MAFVDAVRELQLLIRSRYGLVVLDAPHEDRTERLLRALADEMRLPLLAWSLARGLAPSEPHVATRRTPGGGPGGGIYGTQTLDGALEHLRNADRAGLFVFEGVEPFLHEPVVQAKLLEVARLFGRSDSALILLGTDIELNAALVPHSAYFRLPTPTVAEYRALLQRLFRELQKGAPYAFSLTPEETQQLLENLRGFTLQEAEKVLTKVILEDARLGTEDIRRVMLAKRAVVEREGLLEYHGTDHRLQDVAGMTRLKRWLATRRHLFDRPDEARAFGLTFPKGILLTGVPGVGKSLAAKAVASEWGLPLLRMDTGSLYDKYVGETERNFRRVMRTAEQVAPVVLWIDEIEKAFATSEEGDGGASRRALGSFLTWLQDRAGDVFIVATANDVTRVPPELLRKGRFDEVFFLDLPDARTREDIFRVHLARRGHGQADVDCAVLASATEGFSGAEIEAVVVSALHHAFAERRPLGTPLLMNEVRVTRPLSVTRAESVQAVRSWARERAVSAD